MGTEVYCAIGVAFAGSVVAFGLAAFWTRLIVQAWSGL